MLFFDGTNHPSAATVKADGLDGGMLYGGTPTSPKNFTAAQYADYEASGLFTAFVFEHIVNDMSGGRNAGLLNAAALMADLKAKGVDPSKPVCVAIDEHVSTANLPTAVAYVTGFRDGVRARLWKGPIGVYGFPEVTNACRTVVQWFWGAGRRADQPAFINVWQDNNATIQVGGSVDDKDWLLIPLPTEDPVATFTDADAEVFWGYQNKTAPSNDAHDMHQALKNVEQNSASALMQITALAGSLHQTEVDILNAIKVQAPNVAVDVDALATALATRLNGNEGAQLISALRQVFDQASA